VKAKKEFQTAGLVDNDISVNRVCGWSRKGKTIRRSGGCRMKRKKKTMHPLRNGLPMTRANGKENDKMTISAREEGMTKNTNEQKI